MAVDQVIKTVDPILEAELKQAVESINVIALKAKGVGELSTTEQAKLKTLCEGILKKVGDKETEVLANINAQTTKGIWTYSDTKPPTNKVNPTADGSTWLNWKDGEVWVCTDKTTDKNVWRNTGSGVIIQADGSVDNSNSQQQGTDGILNLPNEAGTKGFGVCTFTDEWCKTYGWRKHPNHHDLDNEMYGTVERQVGTGTIVVKAMPKFYYKVVYDKSLDINIQEEVLISMTPKKGYQLHDAFKNNGKEIPFILRTHYEASNSLGKNTKNGQVQFQTNQMSVSTAQEGSTNKHSIIDNLKGFDTAKGRNKQSKVMDIVKTLNDTGKYNWAICSVQCESAVAMLGKAHFQALFKKANYQAANIDKSLCAYSDKKPYQPRISNYNFKSYDDDTVTFTRDGSHTNYCTLTGSGSDRSKITNTGHITGHIINEANKYLIQIGEYHINSQIYIFDGAKGDITKLDGSLHDITDNGTQRLLGLGFVSIGAGYPSTGCWGVAGKRGFEANPYGITKLRQDAGILRQDFVGSPGLESFGQDYAHVGNNLIKADVMRISHNGINSTYGGMWSKTYNTSHYLNSFRAMYIPEGTKEIDPQYQ